MDSISNRQSVYQSYTDYIIHKAKNMNSEICKYQKQRYISNDTMCQNSDPKIDLLNLKYLYH